MFNSFDGWSNHQINRKMSRPNYKVFALVLLGTCSIDCWQCPKNLRNIHSGQGHSDLRVTQNRVNIMSFDEI